MYAVFVELNVFSQYSTYLPSTSASSEAYPLPPPTTLVGALAYPYTRLKYGVREYINGYSPAIELINEVKYASAGIPLDEIIVPTKNIERLYQHIYLRPDYRRDVGRAYTVGVRPVLYANKMYLLYIVRGSKPDIIKYSYGIIRVGRKESLVSVNKVYVYKVDDIISSDKVCETKFYFPSRIALNWVEKDVSGTEINMPAIRKENFGKGKIYYEKYVVPIPFSLNPIRVAINDKGLILKINNTCVPVPGDIIE